MAKRAQPRGGMSSKAAPETQPPPDTQPSHAKQQREKVPKRRLRNALKARHSSSKNRWKSLDDVLLPERLERLKQQQDSCPSHAKQQREKLPKRRLQNALKARLSSSKNRWKSLDDVLLPERLERRSRIRAQAMRKQQREKLPKRRLQNALKARLSSSKNRWQSLDDVLLPERLERLKQQQDSCPGHAKQQREKVPKRRLRNALIDSPAAKTDGNRWTTCCCRSASKDSNSSRIRAQAMRNSNEQQPNRSG